MKEGSNVLLRKLSFVAIVVSALLLGRQEAHAEPADLVITHAKVVSPPNIVIEDATIVVRGDRIESIGKSGKIPSAKRVIDASNKTVIPGLIDTHVHFTLGPDSPDSDAAYEEWVKDRIVDNMRDLLAHGVTTIVSVGDYWPHVGKLRERFRSGEIIGPRLLITGPLIVPVGGHVATDHVSCSKVPFCVAHMTRQIASADEGRAFIRELAAAHVDAIKIAINDMGTSAGKGKPLGQFPPGVEKALIDEAHAHGLRVIAHAFPYHNAINAINLGADALAHGPETMLLEKSQSTADELLSLAIRKQVPITAVVAGLATHRDNRGRERMLTDVYAGSDLLTPEIAKVLAPMYEQYSEIKRFADRGATIAWGTDTWYLYRFSEGEKAELTELRKTGMTPMQILATGTINAAKLVGKDDQLGSIEKGKIADLVIVASDPLRNLDGLLDRVDVVIKDGAIVFSH